MIVKKFQLQYTKNQYLLSGIFSTLSNQNRESSYIKADYQNSISGNLLKCKLVHTSLCHQVKLVTLRLVLCLKNSNFILEKKMAELTQNKKSNKPAD